MLDTRRKESDDAVGAWQQNTGNAEALDALLETSNCSNKGLLLHNPKLQNEVTAGKGEGQAAYSKRPDTTRAKFNYPSSIFAAQLNPVSNISGRQHSSDFTDSWYRLPIRHRCVFLL